MTSRSPQRLSWCVRCCTAGAVNLALHPCRAGRNLQPPSRGVPCEYIEAHCGPVETKSCSKSGVHGWGVGKCGRTGCQFRSRFFEDEILTNMGAVAITSTTSTFLATEYSFVLLLFTRTKTLPATRMAAPGYTASMRYPHAQLGTTYPWQSLSHAVRLHMNDTSLSPQNHANSCSTGLNTFVQLVNEVL